MNTKLIKRKIDIQLLADYKEHILQLAEWWYEEISNYSVPDASLERTQNNLMKRANRDQLPLALVALENGKPLGMASLCKNDGIQPYRVPWLGGLVVDPVYRGQKIGEQLIDAIKQLSIKLGYHTLYLLAFNPTIPNWYARLGWQLIGNDQLFGHPITIMEIEL